MLFKKLLVSTTLLMAALVSGCNLSTQLAANEVALKPVALEISPTSTLALTPLPTRTPINEAPTLIALGGANVTAQPASQSGAVAAPPTQPPPEGGCSLKATGNYDVNVRTGPGTQFKIMSALPAGQYMLVINQSENGWFEIPWGREAVGWVSPKVVTLFGPCDMLIAQWAADRAQPPTLTPTPTAMFGATIGIPQNNLITKVTVGSIPAGTTVMISGAMFTGSGYIYDIMTVDGRFEKATDAQLMFSSGGGLMPFPTPTATVVVSPTVPVMDLPTDASPSDVVIPDGLCTMTAKSQTTLYASPNTSAAVVGVLNPGPWAQVGATNAQGWYKVTIWTDGRQGWGNISTLTLHGPCDSLPTEGGG